MKWYERLNEYFPEHEMKDPRQLSDLIENQDLYHKEETEDYIVLYAEFPTFLFIDYLLVNPQARGKGTGSKVIDRFKEKGKTIILEVEPADLEEKDSQKRILFYRKNGFLQADHIQYRREDENGEIRELNIFYWSPEDLPQKEIMDKMAKACEEIHNFRSGKYYGRKVADPEEVLRLKKQ